MAPGVILNMAVCACIFFWIAFLFGVDETNAAACQLPEYYQGLWYHRETGVDTELQVVPHEGLWGNSECVGIHYHPNQVTVLTNQGAFGLNTTMLIKANGVDCYRCMDVIYRSANILQYSRTGCYTSAKLADCPGINGLSGLEGLVTMFNRKITPIDCISSIEGRFQFTYEVETGGGGICNSSKSIIEACQTPSSPVYDNKDFTMNYSPCGNLGFKKTVRFKCLGTWVANMGKDLYNFVALANDLQKQPQEIYKCMITQRDQRSSDNTIRWGMSRYGDCRQLTNPEGSPYQIVLRRVIPQMDFLTPQCQLPRNLTGAWFTQGMQFASDVWINETHIQYKTKKSEFDYEETWLSCQAHIGTRYLMSKVVVGRCEINYVCYDIVPRHHSIVRYRVGRPVRQNIRNGRYDTAEENLAKIFKEACSLQWLTFSRDNADWKYEVLIQNPPAATLCPIGGRYYFEQFSTDFYQKYETRIRGVTERPRVKINCRHDVAEFKSCTADESRLEVDASYCETVDYRGRPIGEYEEPDHYLSCAGYWLEDMNSYLITYDEEDPISMFRCWVYERISWTQVAMSRSDTARCPKNMSATNYQVDGPRFALVLTEQERLFDECPIRFDSGIDTSLRPLALYTLDDSHARTISPSRVIVSFVVIFVSLFLW